eukprot:CAMPEP_0118663684 /NCGR_PEP_ID=MMETSP0785-20121206/17569_1 /TAXON_ID=91992 /ORGANISM="Bolidomonas pacifica, Strain CCMP 1866" /LENGTH=37 /DNA_ID= /DNA_START= /DNA_END= /DNA_ORIENTATION=
MTIIVIGLVIELVIGLVIEPVQDMIGKRVNTCVKEKV